MRLRSLAALGGCLIACACSKKEEIPTATISGTVKDVESGQPLGNVVITKTPPMPAETTKSAPDGTFLFPLAGVGVEYHLAASVDNYDSDSTAVTTVEGDNVVSLAIRKKRICTPGQHRCSPDTMNPAVISCKADGTEYITTPCAMGEACLTETSSCATPVYITAVMVGDGRTDSAITSIPGGINCPSTCRYGYVLNTPVILTALPAPNSTFTHWTTGACMGSTMPTCMVVADTAKTLTAEFLATGFTVTVVEAGRGRGRVTSAPVGIDCPGNCAARYPRGIQVTLTASAAAGSTFTGWTGECNGSTQLTCGVLTNTNRTATANFQPPSFPLTVATMGNGMGTVTSAPAGITCGATCMHNFRTGSMVTLTAAADAPSMSTFTGWGGDCQAQGIMPTCTLTMDQPHNVSVSFDTGVQVLTVTRGGLGAGVVTSMPAGINCGATCAAGFGMGSMVTLTANDMGVSTFRGWGGDCTPAGMNLTCTLLMDVAHNASANFDANTFTLTVVKAGSGTGVVGSFPVGIDCGATCNAPFSPGTSVTLTATPAAGSVVSWTGCASMSGNHCTVMMGANHMVTATIDNFYTLPLAADASCTTLIDFDAPTPLAQACGGGAAAVMTGSFNSVASRSTALGTAIQAGGATEEGWVDLMKAGPTPPSATVEMTLSRTGNAFNAQPFGVVYSDQPVQAMAQPGFVLAVYNDGHLSAATLDGAGGTSTVQSAAGVIAANQWYHVAVTLDATAGIALFVDGAPIAQTAGPLSWAASSSTAWAGAAREDMSGTNAATRFNGKIDEIRVSNMVRY